ncbi:MAG: PHP domain-containing protein [Anaerolineae bacterium]|nr:PHP domain-containing protein [Anaerolineae bacterium]
MASNSGLREYRADLHLHTLASACAEVEMLPPLVLEEARFHGLNILAITDHNSTGNVAAFMEAAKDTEITVLPGMELLTREEVDMICVFDTLEQIADWQAYVDAHLPPLQNDPDSFGPQFLVDKDGDFVAEDPLMRKLPALLSLTEAIQRIHALGGLAIPAHIDRKVYGLMPVLGLWPPDLNADAAEVSPNIRPSAARRRYPSIPSHMPLISNSDAHCLDVIGRSMTVFVLRHAPSVAELRLALQGAGQRRFYVP